MTSKLIASAIVAGLFAGTANAQFFDDFEAGTVGNNVVGYNGWEEWDGVPGGDSIIQAAPGGGKCLEVKLTSDAVHTFSGYNSGQWSFKADSYLPSALIDDVYFLILNGYQHGGPYSWSVQLHLNASTGLWVVDAGSASTNQGSLIMDAWIECRAEIDLNLDQVEVFYNGASTALPYTWTGTVFGSGGGTLNIGCIDLYAPTTSATSVAYWDNVSLAAPAPAPTIYCTAKVNSLGCTPTISGTGTPSATGVGSFNVSVAQVRNNKAGLFFYGNTGQLSAPFQGGTLCVNTPIRRTPVSLSGGNPAPANDCSGTYTLDFNCFTIGGCGGAPAPFLAVPGNVINAQNWCRDQGFPAPNNTGLSDAIEWTQGA